MLAVREDLSVKPMLSWFGGDFSTGMGGFESITRRRRLTGLWDVASGAVTIVTYEVRQRMTARWRPLLTILLASLVLVAVVGSGLPCAEAPPPHPPHVVSASVGGGSADAGDHPHVNVNRTHTFFDAFDAVVLPRITTALAALVVLVAVVAAMVLLAPRIAAAVRGPPGRLAVALTGQDVLTRFCTYRR